MSLRALPIAFSLVLACASPALTQPPPNPKTEARPESKESEAADLVKAPPLKQPTISTQDAELRAVIGALVGSFQANESGGRPTLRLNTSPITVTGWDNAIYFELSRADSPAHPFRQGVFHLYRRQGQVTLRQLAFANASSSYGLMLAGLWAAPEGLPVLESDQLQPVADIRLAGADGAWRGDTRGPVPTTVAGAIEFVGAVEIAQGGLKFAERGYDANGKQVWGPADNETVAFARMQPAVVAQRRDDGLVIVDLVPGRAGEAPAAQGSDLAMQYTGWALDSGYEFDSSRKPGREPLRMTVPGALIPGWNLGVPGMRLGTVRKLVIPGHLGWGERGNPRIRVGPNATVVFETELVWHKPNAAPSPAETVEGAQADGKTNEKPQK